MKKYLLLLLTLFLVGCVAKVPLTSFEEDLAAKQFKPEEGYAGLYIYRKEMIAPQETRTIWLDGSFLAESAPLVYFYKLIKPGMHLVEVESQFGKNSLTFMAEAGKNYFIHQYMAPGFFRPTAQLEQVVPYKAKEDIFTLRRGQSY